MSGTIENIPHGDPCFRGSCGYYRSYFLTFAFFTLPRHRNMSFRSLFVCIDTNIISKLSFQNRKCSGQCTGGHCSGPSHGPWRPHIGSDSRKRQLLFPRTVSFPEACWMVCTAPELRQDGRSGCRFCYKALKAEPLYARTGIGVAYTWFPLLLIRLYRPAYCRLR